MLGQCNFALESSISDLADLLAIKLAPLVVVKVLIKGFDVLSGPEVYEGIPHIALVLNVMKKDLHGSQ